MNLEQVIKGVAYYIAHTFSTQQRQMSISLAELDLFCLMLLGSRFVLRVQAQSRSM
jgi:hypothetical protein